MSKNISKETFSKFLSDPFGFVIRGLYKITIGKIKYGRGKDYDAVRYWHDRFSKYGFSLKAVGPEGLSEEENKKMYMEAARIFMSLCQKEEVDFKNANILEIGVGTGFCTQLLYNCGVTRYTGIDITDVLFPTLRRMFRNFSFIKKDVTTEKIDGKFDLVIMIDVIEHIVNASKLSYAMQNVKQCLSENGVFILAPIREENKRLPFYERSWSLETIKKEFSNYAFSELIPFRDDYILSIRNRSEHLRK